jgi:hypothetical protein
MVSFSTEGCSAAKFVIFSQSTNLLNMTGSIALVDGEGNVVERLLLNPGDNPAVGAKTITVSKRIKGAALDMLRTLSLPQVDPANPVAKLCFNLDWHPTAGDKRSKEVKFEIFFRARKMRSEGLTVHSKAMLN